MSDHTKDRAGSFSSADQAEITEEQLQRLEEYEKTIDQYVHSTLSAGRALAIIKREELYRAKHESFEDYCRERFDLEHSQVYRLIRAAEVLDNLSPIGEIPMPANEAQVRPLTNLASDQQRKIWKEVVAKATRDGVRITAALVQQTVDQPCSRKTQKPIAKVSSPTDPQANSTNHRNAVRKPSSGDGVVVESDGCDQTARPATVPAMIVSLMNGGKYRTEGWDDSTSLGRALRSSIEQMANTPADQSAVTPTYKNSTARQQRLVLRMADAVFPEIGQSLSASKVKEIECACTQLIKVLTAAYHASRADQGAGGQGELLFGEPEAEQGSSNKSEKEVAA